jgi:hypothetical protein
MMRASLMQAQAERESVNRRAVRRMGMGVTQATGLAMTMHLQLRF